MLGVTHDELVGLPAGAFSPSHPTPRPTPPFASKWQRQGTPDIGGEATLRRPDGSSARVKFGITPIEEGRFVAVLELIGAPTDAAPVVYTAGQVLAEWRAAERRLTRSRRERPSGAPSATTSMSSGAATRRCSRPVAIPPTFRAYVAERIDEDGVPRIDRGVGEFAAADLPPGDVEIRVAWSSVNFKDGLATKIDGKVARISPLIPGIDLAGEVDREHRPRGRGRVDGPRPRLRPEACRVTVASPSTSGAAQAGSSARSGPLGAGCDGHRDGRLHRGDVSRGARGTRARAG